MEVDLGMYYIIFEGLKVNGVGKLDMIRNIIFDGGVVWEMVYNFEVGMLVIGV